MENLEKIFKSILPNPNFCTPDVIGYFRKGRYILELSTDNVCFCGLYVYGVTVVNDFQKVHCDVLCKSFTGTNREEVKKCAEEYIENF